MAFPLNLDDFQNPTPKTPTNSPTMPLSGQISQLNNAVEAIEGVIGVTGSTVPTSIDKRLADVETAATAATAHAAAVAPHSGHSTPASVSAAIASAITDNGLVGYLTTGVGASGQLILSPYDSAEVALGTVLLLTTSSDTFSSAIGTASIKPTGAAGTNSDPSAAVNTIRGTPWVVDSGYVAGSAAISTILGGYDHVCNQDAGCVVGGGHNYIQYNVGGHSCIFGGANNRIDGSRSVIIGGTSCTVNNGGSFCVVVGGIYNTCQGQHAVIAGGDNNVCQGATSGILSGEDNTIASGATHSAAIAGQANTIGATADYAVALGGWGNSVTHDNAVVMGTDGISDGTATFVVSRTKLVKAGDCQGTIQQCGLRTTNSTLSNLTPYFQLVSTDKAAVAIRAQIVGMDEATGALAVYMWDGGMIWDGSSTATFYDAGGSGASRNFTQIVDNIGCAAVPVWSGTSAAVRPKVTGKASTNIKWSCTAIFSVTRL